MLAVAAAPLPIGLSCWGTKRWASVGMSGTKRCAAASEDVQNGAGNFEGLDVRQLDMCTDLNGQFDVVLLL